MQGSRSKKLAAVTSCIALVALVSTASSTAAQASTYPYACTITYSSDNRASAQCLHGDVQYRVGAACVIWPGYVFEVYENWVWPGGGNRSTIACPVGSGLWVAPGNARPYPWIDV